MGTPAAAANYLASRELVTPRRLREFFAPKSIVMVGASDNSGWGRFIVASCQTTGFGGPLMIVHPRARTAYGLPVVPSLRDLPGPADLAFILAPVPAVESVLADMGAAGVKNAVVLASGYREVGDDGRALEDALVSRAIANGITVLGPNCLGFLNARTRAAPYALTVPPPLIAGPVAVVLQSGALTSVVLAFTRAHAIGVSVLTSVGNECMIKTVDVIDYLVEDDATKVICLFLEEIGDPARFAQVAEKASRAGKPIVALKVGSSQVGQQAALAHTGSVAGNDAVVDAALRQLNVIRVTSLEELLTTGAMLGYNRWPRGRRMGVLTASGGSCDIIADAASTEGLQIPDFAPPTAAAITRHLPPFASARNPLDVTGFGLANVSARTGTMTAIDHALDTAVDDPHLDFVSVQRGEPAGRKAAGRGHGGDAGGTPRLAGPADGLRAHPGHPDRRHVRRRQRLRARDAEPARPDRAWRAQHGDQGGEQRAALAGEPGRDPAWAPRPPRSPGPLGVSARRRAGLRSLAGGRRAAAARVVWCAGGARRGGNVPG